jgi:hypothetical protein
MSRLASLKAAKSLSDVANLLHFKPAALSYILFKLSPAVKYQTFEIAMVHSLFSTGRFELYGAVERSGVITVEKREGTL